MSMTHLTIYTFVDKSSNTKNIFSHEVLFVVTNLHFVSFSKEWRLVVMFTYLKNRKHTLCHSVVAFGSYVYIPKE